VSKRARIIIGVLLGAIAAAIVATVITFRALEPRMHDWVSDNLSKALDSKIELGEVHVRWLPLQLHAHDLKVRHRGRTDIPPLFVVKAFIVDLKPWDLRSSTIDRVWVDGLEVNIPPKDPETGKRPLPGRGQGDETEASGLVIRELIATNTKLTIVPAQANKTPKEWDVRRLVMKNLRAGEPASYVASIINPIPEGPIEASGTFGPWQKKEPGTSAITGDYKFAADMGTIRGLSGQLTAQGEVSGTIEQMATKGKTHVADFRLTELDGVSLPVDAVYDAMVDGTKGDVELNAVDVTLGKSKLFARGTVLGTSGVKGKRVVVNVKSSAANLGELLRFVSKAGPPPATGTLMIDAAMDLPQGKQPILERLELQGSVRADRVTFSNVNVQDKIDDLSRRAQGRPTDQSIDEVASSVATKFALRQGVLAYQGLSFAVEGAEITLDGTHSLKSKALAFEGVANLRAPVSKMVAGVKSWFLKPLDPLFRHNGSTRLVIRIDGSQDQPKVGLNFKKTVKGN
jgi:hypothetical protein